MKSIKKVGLCIALLVLCVAIGFVVGKELKKENKVDETSKNVVTQVDYEEVTDKVTPTVALSIEDKKVNELIGNNTVLEVPSIDVDKSVAVVEAVANLIYNGFDCNDSGSVAYKELQSKLSDETFDSIISTLKANIKTYEGEVIDITEDVNRILAEKLEEDERLKEYEDITYEDWYAEMTEKATAQYNKMYPKVDLKQPWQVFIGTEIKDESGNVLYSGNKTLDTLTEDEISIIKNYYEEFTGNRAVIETDEQYFEHYGTYPDSNESDNNDTQVEWFGICDGIDWSWLSITKDMWNREHKFRNYSDELDSRVNTDGKQYYVGVDSIESNTGYLDINVYGKYITIDTSGLNIDYRKWASDYRYMASVDSYDFWYKNNGNEIVINGYVKVIARDDIYECSVTKVGDKISLDNNFIKNVCTVIGG